MKTKKTLSRLYIKTLLLAIPFIGLTIVYIVNDPFMVIRSHEDYDHPVVKVQNQGYIAWQKYKKYRNLKHYDSFIMGASCSMAFQSEDWLKHIKGSPFRLFSNNESLGDLELKLRALEKQPGQKINNVLIVTDPRLLGIVDIQEEIPNIMPSEVSGCSTYYIQKLFFCGFFFQKKFFSQYLTYLLTGYYEDTPGGVINDKKEYCSRYANNQILYAEKEIAKKGKKAFYDASSWDIYRGRISECIRERMLYSPQIDALKRIKAILDRNHTNVKIAIGPEIECDYIHPIDEKILIDIFGAKNVVIYNTAFHTKEADFHNFYDYSHYNRAIAQRMMNELYREQKSKSK